MHVVIIAGSARKEGNSDLLCDAFAQGARDAGHNIEKICLADKNIQYCKACYACFQTGHCVLKDDMESILEQIQSADVLVFASPTYFLTMSGQMKVMIDRLLPKWQDLGGKEAYVIVTGHDDTPGLIRVGQDLACILENLGCICKKILYGKRVWQKGEVLQTSAMEEAYEMGRSIGS